MKELETILRYLEENLDYEKIQASEKHIKISCAFKGSNSFSYFYNTVQTEFQPFSMHEIHGDMAKMMYNELIGCAAAVISDDDRLPMLRANYGVGTLPSMLGIPSYITENNMPWVKHLETTNDIKRVIERGIPEKLGGFADKVKDTYVFYRETLRNYPNCERCIKLYHPDFQGPFDAAHLIWGSDIYYALYDDADLVLSLLSLVTKTYIHAMDEILDIANDESDGYIYHWNTLYPGKILLRNDSAVNLSADMYKEFVQPFDEEIIAHYGTASIHHCGRADHLLSDLLKTKGLKGLNFGAIPGKELFGSAHFNEIYPIVKEAGVNLIAYPIQLNEVEQFRHLCLQGGYSLCVISNR